VAGPEDTVTAEGQKDIDIFLISEQEDCFTLWGSSSEKKETMEEDHVRMSGSFGFSPDFPV